MSIQDHIQKIKADQEKQKARREKGSTSNANIWHNWRDNDQVVRFVGDFVLTKTYWLGKSNFNSLNLFPESAFEGENKIPKIMNCANWDITNEKFIDNGDILFLLNKIAREILKTPGIDADAKKKFELLKGRTDPSTYYRWNIIDRDEPTVKGENGEDTVKGFQIANLGYELFESMLSIHDDYAPASFSSIEEGIDVKISKSNANGRTKYRATPVLKKGTIQITPLTDEEKSWELINLKEVCGKQVDQDLVFKNLLPEWQELINDYKSDIDKK